MSTNQVTCDTCGRAFNSLGIARHRAMHRDRHENCTETSIRIHGPGPNMRIVAETTTYRYAAPSAGHNA
jgi:hypothetical protein